MGRVGEGGGGGGRVVPFFPFSPLFLSPLFPIWLLPFFPLLSSLLCLQYFGSPSVPSLCSMHANNTCEPFIKSNSLWNEILCYFFLVIGLHHFILSCCSFCSNIQTASWAYSIYLSYILPSLSSSAFTYVWNMYVVTDRFYSSHPMVHLADEKWWAYSLLFPF